MHKWSDALPITKNMFMKQTKQNRPYRTLGCEKAARFSKNSKLKCSRQSWQSAQGFYFRDNVCCWHKAFFLHSVIWMKKKEQENPPECDQIICLLLVRRHFQSKERRSNSKWKVLHLMERRKEPTVSANPLTLKLRIKKYV